MWCCHVSSFCWGYDRWLQRVLRRYDHLPEYQLVSYLKKEVVLKNRAKNVGKHGIVYAPWNVLLLHVYADFDVDGSWSLLAFLDLELDAVADLGASTFDIVGVDENVLLLSFDVDEAEASIIEPPSYCSFHWTVTSLNLVFTSRKRSLHTWKARIVRYLKPVKSWILHKPTLKHT